MVDISRRDALDFFLKASLVAVGSLASLSPANAKTQLTKIEERLPAPDLDIPDLAGNVHAMGDYSGQVVLVSFWAMWCPPCRREMPSLARLSRLLRHEKFTVLAVNLGDKPKRVGQFAQELNLSDLPILLDSRSSLSASWHLRGLPVSYVVDQKGHIRFGAIGEREWDSPVIQEQIQLLLENAV